MASHISPLGQARRTAAPAPAMSGLLVRMIGLIESWAERRRQRRALLELSDALLKDVGLARSDAEIEACKPFWRD